MAEKNGIDSAIKNFASKKFLAFRNIDNMAESHSL